MISQSGSTFFASFSTALIKDGKIFTVEEIQNIIEDLLMRSERKDVAKAYILYRFEHFHSNRIPRLIVPS